MFSKKPLRLKTITKKPLLRRKNYNETLRLLNWNL